MPRANRYFLPVHIWYLTHRCHKQELLLKFAKNRGCSIRWLFEARKRFVLCVEFYGDVQSYSSVGKGHQAGSDFA